MINPNCDKNLIDWYEQKKAAVYATGWRQHGGKINDKVRFHCKGDYDDDELYEEIDGIERRITLRIEDEAIGEITYLTNSEDVLATFPCTIGYWDNGLYCEYHDHEEIRGYLTNTTDTIDKFWWFELIVEPKENSHQLSMF